MHLHVYDKVVENSVIMLDYIKNIGFIFFICRTKSIFEYLKTNLWHNAVDVYWYRFNGILNIYSFGYQC